MNKDVKKYLHEAPAEYRSSLQEIRTLITTCLPTAVESLPNGFPVYTIDDIWCSGFAYRKNKVMFYLMRHSILDKYEKQLGKLRTGKSCIVYKASKSLSMEQLQTLIRKMLSEIPASISA